MQKYQLLSKKFGQPIAEILTILRQPAQRGRSFHYLAASILVGLAVAMSMALAPLNKSIPFLAFVPAVALAAVFGGMGPGIFAALGSMMAATYLFFPPYHSFSFAFQTEVITANSVFFISVLIICFVIELMRRAQRSFIAELGRAQDAEEALRASEANLNTAQEVAHIGSWALDTRHNILTWSKEIHHIFGVPAGTPLTYETYRSHVHPDDGDYVDRQWAAALRGEPYDIEHRIIVDGQIKWVREQAKLIRDADGHLIGSIGTSQDITERKLNEIKLRQAEAELEKHRNHLEKLVEEKTRELNAANVRLQEDIRERDQAEQKRLELEKKLAQAEKKLTTIAAFAPGVIYALRERPDGSICLPYASPAIRDLYGLCAENLAKDATPAFAMTHPDDRQHLDKTRAESSRTLCPWYDEWRIRHPEKGDIWLEGRSVPEREPDGCTLWYGFIHDITERKRAEDALKEMDVRKNEFLAMLGHELRNPLAPIRNVVQTMKAYNFTDPVLEGGLTIIERQVSHLTRLIDDLLDVARIMQDKITLKRQCLDFADVVDSAVEESRPLIETRRQQLIISPPETPQWIEGDRVRLTQVFSNLLNNAAKYTPKGGKIMLNITQEDSWIVTKVEDTGMGIPAKILPRIFDLFTQAKRSLNRSQGGMGVGLTLVRRLVEMHQGTITAASAGIGQGSVFTVRLPLLNICPLSKSFAQPKSPSSPSQLRILVVDDYADAAESLALMLQLKGYEVITAGCGLKGIEQAVSFRPQVVLLDIGLPDMDGYEVARQLRQLPETRDALLIALTGYGQPEDRELSKAAGFDHHLLKPVDPEALFALLALRKPGL
ncbi:PAS domain S-box-containing protein (fragment) [Candidatus Methylobacter favarea]|uniref:histidine kinase n=1 Tax=Candidatus Methylobacter favarea TaxID=2707345 RepID=A0A8S0X2C6_9GAMM